MIIFYSKTCEDCSGNRALASMKAYCAKNNIEFEPRRTIFWEVWAKEAKEISQEMNVSIPFFYSTEAKIAIQGNSLTPIMQIEDLVKKELESKQVL